MGVLGRLKDYHPLLDLLTSRNIKLNADAAGTLIATVDVEGGISFEDFMECVAMSFKGSEKQPPPEGHAQPQEAVAPAPAPVRGVVKGLGAPMLPLDAARSTYRMPEPTTTSSDMLLVKRPTFDPTKLDVRNMLGGRVGRPARRRMITSRSCSMAALLMITEGSRRRSLR